MAEYSYTSAPTNFTNNEEACLYGNNLDSSTPFLKHDRSWISIPALAIRTAQPSFIACGVHRIVLASFWVLVLIAYGVLWTPGAWFLLSWATLCFIGFLLSFIIDQASRRSPNSRRMWMTYASILPMLVCSSPHFVHLGCNRSMTYLGTNSDSHSSKLYHFYDTTRDLPRRSSMAI